MRWLLAVAFALMLGSGAPVRAEWHAASSDHFVVFADGRASDIQRFAEMLERYHAAMALLTGRNFPPPSPSGRVTIYEVGGERTMRELSGSRNVAGFYVPRAGGSRAFVPNIRVTNGEPDFSMTVLMHEYAHHFLISSSRFAMPHWLSEGAAEFFASTKFPKDGSVQIGRPAYHRAVEIQYADSLPAEELLQRSPSVETRDAFYGRSWLLYHFLFFDQERKGQLGAYWQAVSAGLSSRDAATASFGDLDELDRDLARYQRQRKMNFWNFPAVALPIGPVSVRPVSAGLAEMLPVIIRSQRGVDREEAVELVPQARRIAARHPGDPHVLAALAEAEYDAGNDAEALAVADRALAIDHTVENALIQKGYALFRMAETADDPDRAYLHAMAPFEALNALENDHPLPLIYLYRSYSARGLEPSETARHALERAAELAPFDQGLWLNAALMEAGEGKIALARTNLAPLAADPHGGRLAEDAALLNEALAQEPEGEPFDGIAFLAAASLARSDAAASASGPEPALTDD